MEKKMSGNKTVCSTPVSLQNYQGLSMNFCHLKD